jgi:hypothetical protein
MLVQSKFGRVFASILLLVSILFTPMAGRALSEDDPRKVPPFALLKGSCFDQRGFSLPGVAILVTLPPGETKKKKGKRWRTQSDRRGEFAVRLPAGGHTVFVTAKKKGFESAKKSIQFHNDEQQHIVVRMKPVSASK